MRPILYLDHSGDFSGGQKSLLALLSVLDLTRFRPVVIIDRKANRMASELTVLGIEHVKINYFNYAAVQYLLVWLPVIRIWRLMIKYNCLLLHCNTFKAGAIGGLLSFVSRVPVIFRARLSIVHHPHGVIDKFILANTDLVLANSNFVKETFEQRFGVSNKVKVIYNPLSRPQPLNDVTLDSLRKRFLPQKDTFYFGAIGRIEEGKRLHEIIEAVRLINTEKKFKVLFIGDFLFEGSSAYYDHLQTLLGKYELTHLFEFTGFVRDITEMTSLLQCVILCSEGEALSRGVYESQLYGVPVIASRSGGNLELVKDGTTGFLYALSQPAELASRMQLIMNDKVLAEKISGAAALQTATLFAAHETIDREQAEYDSLAGPSRLQ